MNCGQIIHFHQNQVNLSIFYNNVPTYFWLGPKHWPRMPVNRIFIHQFSFKWIRKRGAITPTTGLWM